jgi:hypothetical protein
MYEDLTSGVAQCPLSRWLGGEPQAASGSKLCGRVASGVVRWQAAQRADDPKFSPTSQHPPQSSPRKFRSRKSRSHPAFKPL